MLDINPKRYLQMLNCMGTYDKLNNVSAVLHCEYA